MAASTIFFGATRGIKDLTEKVIELDSAMVNLARVTDLNDYQLNNMLERSIENVDTLSGKMSEYLEILNEVSRMGIGDANDSLALTNVTQVLTNISDLDAKQAVDSLVAGMIAFGIEAQNAMDIADKLNEVDNNFSISTQNLALSLNKAASTAKTFGVSLDELIGYTTAIGSATRESGKFCHFIQRCILKNWGKSVKSTIII